MRSEEPAAEQQRGGAYPEHPPVLTVAEAARVCGVSTSTIRRYLRAGRFPSARREPSPVPGQPAQWRIPTEDLLGAGLDQRRPSGHVENRQAAGEPAGGWADRGRVEALEHALELERARRQAAECLAAERARTIVALETALRALEHRRFEPAAEEPGTAPAAPPSSAAGQTSRPAPPAGVLQMVPRPRRPKGELSQEERAAIIGWALSREHPTKRRWRWW